MALSLARRVAVTEEKVESLETTVSEIRAGLRELRDDLRREIREGDEETRRQMRVLHEDVIARIALLQEGINARNGRQRKAKRRSN